MILLEVVMFGLLGVILGSFSNAWAVRLLNGKSIARGRSECPQCRHMLAWYDNIPILSFILLKGRCRYCKKTIGIKYLLAEVGSGLLFGALYLHFLPHTTQKWVLLVLWCTLSVFLIAAFITDWLELVLPDQLMIPSIVLGLLIAIVSIYMPGQQMVWTSVAQRAIQAGIFVLIYCALYFGSKGKFIGDGDIRLAAILGLVLTLPQLLVGVFAAYVIGAAVGGFCIVSKLKTRKDVIAFGPFLIAGLYFGLFFGTQIAQWYLSLV